MHDSNQQSDADLPTEDTWAHHNTISANKAAFVEELYQQTGIPEVARTAGAASACLKGDEALQGLDAELGTDRPDRLTVRLVDAQGHKDDLERAHTLLTCFEDHRLVVGLEHDDPASPPPQAHLLARGDALTVTRQDPLQPPTYPYTTKQHTIAAIEQAGLTLGQDAHVATSFHSDLGTHQGVATITLAPRALAAPEQVETLVHHLAKANLGVFVPHSDRAEPLPRLTGPLAQGQAVPLVYCPPQSPARTALKAMQPVRRIASTTTEQQNSSYKPPVHTPRSSRSR